MMHKPTMQLNIQVAMEIVCMLSYDPDTHATHTITCLAIDKVCMLL